MKTQSIRLIDVFLIGPLLIAAGLSEKQEPILNKSLIAIGILTILYNAKNYLSYEKEKTSHKN